MIYFSQIHFSNSELRYQRISFISFAFLNYAFIVIYNYFTGKLRELYFTKGSQDQFCLQNIQTKLVEETRG